eukprot:15323064-Alexandrium_andersonii.AAC.1
MDLSSGALRAAAFGAGVPSGPPLDYTVGVPTAGWDLSAESHVCDPDGAFFLFPLRGAEGMRR